MVRTKKEFTKAYLLGIDYGNKNVGLALGRDGLVAPLKTLTSAHTQTLLHEIMRTAIENKVEAFVLGLPLRADGKDTEKSIEVRQFANRLKIYSKKPIIYQNEYASTIDATNEMIEFDISQKRRHTKDHYAAALILKRYFQEVK